MALVVPETRYGIDDCAEGTDYLNRWLLSRYGETLLVLGVTSGVHYFAAGIAITVLIIALRVWIVATIAPGNKCASDSPVVAPMWVGCSAVIVSCDQSAAGITALKGAHNPRSARRSRPVPLAQSCRVITTSSAPRSQCSASLLRYFSVSNAS